MCQYAVRETWLWKRQDYLWRGRDHNGEVEGLVEGIESNDIERVASRAVAGAGNAGVELADGDAGTESHAYSRKRSNGRRQLQNRRELQCDADGPLGCAARGSATAIFGSAGEANWPFVAAASFSNSWKIKDGGTRRS